MGSPLDAGWTQSLESQNRGLLKCLASKLVRRVDDICGLRAHLATLKKNDCFCTGYETGSGSWSLLAT